MQILCTPPHTQNSFSDGLLKRQDLFEINVVITAITFSKRSLVPAGPKSDPTVFNQVGPGAPRLLDAEHIISPKTFHQNVDLPL